MATPNQEKTYNEFVKFYDLADNIVSVASNSNKPYNKSQFDEVEKTILYLEESVDKLTQNYIEIVKNSQDHVKIEEVRAILNDIQDKSRKCRENLMKIYEQNS